MGRSGYTAPRDESSRLEELSGGWPRQIAHPLHKQHPLAKTLRRAYNCDSCSALGQDWSFYCAACDFDLHPDCAREALLQDSAKPWPGTVDHRLHRAHPLVKTRLDTFWCDSCGESGRWWCFYCEPCDFGVHLNCAVGPGRLQASERPPAVELARAERESYWCARCSEEGKGLCYTWEDLDLELHPRCAEKKGAWPRTVAHELHKEHELLRVQNVGYFCDRCWTEGKGWSFGCDACNFHLHPKCAVGAPAEESGWIDEMLHEQQKQRILQHMQDLQQQQAQTAPSVQEEEDDGDDDDDDDGEVVIRFTGGRAGGGGLVQEVPLQQLPQLVETMNQLEQMRLLGEMISLAQGGSAQSGLPPRRQDPPNSWPYPNNRFGYY